ncbi:hypothetical protein [Streptomyces sp. MBT72]|nr:hypothetical protein [Streptomyces sp. MBT72]
MLGAQPSDRLPDRRTALAAERERALYEAVKEFRLAARAAIGQAV